MRWLLCLALAAPLLAEDIDWDGAVKAVREEMGEGFEVEHVGRFVMATDASEKNREVLKVVLTRDADTLLKDYFTTAPTWPLTAYLLWGKKSYGAYAKKRLGHDPDTPYGFYHHDGHYLLMNVATGTGTLVHEMFHALVEADFPQIPSWFNEGMGSLHEQCMLENGSLKGLTNWRLPILQEELKKGTCPSWEKLVHMSTDEFYDDRKSDNYAVARYLCLWLQEQGLLRVYYTRFRDHAKDDPTGWETLKAVIGRPVEEVERDWRAWAAKLEWKH